MERKLKIAGALKQYEAAEYIGATIPTFMNFCDEGYIKPSIYPNGMKLYSVRELDRFIEEFQI